MRKRLRNRIDRLAPSPSPRRRAVVSWIGSHAPKALRARGRPAAGDADVMLGTKIVLAAAGLCAGGLSAHGVRAIAAAAILAAGGWRWPDFRAARRAETRRRVVLAALPDMLDLLAACARAGASVSQAFELAAARDDGPLGEAIKEAVRALALGLPRDRAYAVLAARADVPEVRSVVAALRRAEGLGTSIASTTTELAREVREERRARAEEGARGAPVRVLFPVIVCFLPAFGLLTVAPVVIVALRGFRSV